MDKIVGSIANYAQALQYEDLPAQVVRQCQRCLLDTLGVAFGGYDAEPCRVVRDLALRARIPEGARLFGTGERVLPELAAFANSVMVRYLDGNDAYAGGGGHPSDTIPGILALADLRRSSGRDVITAIVLAYEIYHNFWKNAGVRRKHLDNVFYDTVGGAVGAAKILQLDAARIGETLSLAITPNIPLDATRYGQLSVWKGCASGNAIRNAVFAALLAETGITGPEKPIEGGHGLHRLLGEFEVGPFGSATQPFGIEDVTLKQFEAVAHALSPITAALDLHGKLAGEAVEHVTLYTNKHSWEVAGREPEKWHPATREAADHSLPYITAAVLTYGTFSDELFSEKYLRDARIRDLIARVEVQEDPEFTSQHPEKILCRIEAVTTKGERKVASVEYPRGHNRNPMSDDEVVEKFRRISQSVLSPAQMDKVIEAVWALDTAPNVDALFEALTIVK